jgi:hypothetical protein
MAEKRKMDSEDTSGANESSSVPTDLSELGEEFIGYAPKASAGQTINMFEKEELQDHKHPAPSISFSQFKTTRYYKDTFNSETLVEEAMSDREPKGSEKLDSGSTLPDDPIKVETATGISNNTSVLEVPFKIGQSLSSMRMIEGSFRKNYFHLVFKPDFMIRLNTFGDTFSNIIDVFFKHYDHFNWLQMGSIPLQPNIYNESGYVYGEDPMNINDLMKSLKPTKFADWNPVWVGRSVHEFSDDPSLGGDRDVNSDIGDGTLAVGVSADVGLSEYERSGYRNLHVLNMNQLTKADHKRQYMRLFDNEFEYTKIRPVGEDVQFTWYWLPKVTDQLPVIVEANRAALTSIWDMKRTFVSKAISWSGLSTSEVSNSLNQLLNVRTQEFNTINKFVSSIQQGRGASHMTALSTVILWNRWFIMHYELDFTKFDFLTLMECFSAKVMNPLSTLDLSSRRQIDQYFCTFFFNMVNGLDFHVDPGQRYDQSVIIDAVAQFEAAAIARGAAIPEAPAVNDRRGGELALGEALEILFLQWSRGVRITEDEAAGAGDIGFGDIGADRGISIPGELGAYHINTSRNNDVGCFLTNKTDKNYDIIWDKIRALRVVGRTVLAMSGGRGSAFTYRNPKTSYHIGSVLIQMANSFYRLQGYAIQYNEVIRQMSFIPDTLTVCDGESEEVQAEFEPSRIDVLPGDMVSALLTLNFENTELKFDAQTMVDDAWSGLQSVDEWLGRFNLIKDWYIEFLNDNPSYKNFLREFDLISLAWKHTLNKHPIAHAIHKEFEKYGSRPFFRITGVPNQLVQHDAFAEGVLIRGSQFITDKLESIKVLFTNELDSGRLGIDNVLMVKPTSRINHDNYRYFNVFDEVKGSRVVPYRDFIVAVSQGLRRNRANDGIEEEGPFTVDDLLEGNDIVIRDFYYNLNLGGPPQFLDLASILEWQDSVKVPTINTTHEWNDIRVNIDVAKSERFPQVGAVKFPVEILVDRDWRLDPWWKRGDRVLIREKFDLVQHVERNVRS